MCSRWFDGYESFGTKRYTSLAQANHPAPGTLPFLLDPGESVRMTLLASTWLSPAAVDAKEVD